MNTLLQDGLTNALAATALAVLALLASKSLRRPALSHALWLLVLIKLITPPLIVVPIALPKTAEEPMPPEMQQVAAVAAPIVPPREAEQDTTPKDLPQEQVGPVKDKEDVLRTFPVPARQDIIPVVPIGSDKAEPVPPGQDAEQQRGPPVVADVFPEHEIPLAAVEPAGIVLDVSWTTIVGVVWIAGSVVWFGVALMRIRRFQRVLRDTQPAPAWLQREASELAARMGLSDCPGVWLAPGVLSPLLWAVCGYPRLLVPAGLLVRLDAMQRQTLLAHELAHYRRRDHWVRCLEFAALGIYWWFPVVWWARRELREAEEECCDAWVIWTLPRAAKAYASALVETLDFLSGSRPTLPLVASGLGQLDLLRRRLTMIMRGSMPRKLGGLGLLAVLGLAALLLPMVPGWAEQSVAPLPQQDIIIKIEKGQQPVPPVPPVPPGGQPKDLMRAKANLERAAADLEMMKMQLAKLQADFERRMAEFQKAQEQLKKAEKAAGAKGAVAAGTVTPKGGQFDIQIKELKDHVFVLGGANAEIEKRLNNMERKLDEVLQEIRSLRKGMGSTSGQPGIPPNPGGKGGAGGGKGGGKGGAGGGGAGQGGGGGGGPGGAGAGAGGKGGGGGGFIFSPPPMQPGQPRVNIFNLPLDQQYDALAEALGDDMARYIMLVRQGKNPPAPPIAK